MANDRYRTNRELIKVKMRNKEIFKFILKKTWTGCVVTAFGRRMFLVSIIRMVSGHFAHMSVRPCQKVISPTL